MLKIYDPIYYISNTLKQIRQFNISKKEEWKYVR